MSPLPPAELSELDRSVYRALAGYAFDEAECWPSQKLLALDTGLSRETVNRSLRRLIEAGWTRIKERRWSWRERRLHNVYELLAPYAVSLLSVARITKRAHRRARLRKRARAQAQRAVRNPFAAALPRPDHTNTEDWCRCGWCRPDRNARDRGGPPPLPPGYGPRLPVWVVEMIEDLAETKEQAASDLADERRFAATMWKRWRRRTW